MDVLARDRHAIDPRHNKATCRFSAKFLLKLSGMVLGLGLSLGNIAPAMTSDHDGATYTKSRNLNLTDLYVFPKDNQNPHVHSAFAFFDKGPQFIRIHDVG